MHEIFHRSIYKKYACYYGKRLPVRKFFDTNFYARNFFDTKISQITVAEAESLEMISRVVLSSKGNIVLVKVIY